MMMLFIRGDLFLCAEEQKILLGGQYNANTKNHGEKLKNRAGVKNIKSMNLYRKMRKN